MIRGATLEMQEVQVTKIEHDYVQPGRLSVVHTRSIFLR